MRGSHPYPVVRGFWGRSPWDWLGYEDTEESRMVNQMVRLLCKLLGHRWKVFRDYHYLEFCECQRCHKPRPHDWAGTCTCRRRECMQRKPDASEADHDW